MSHTKYLSVLLQSLPKHNFLSVGQKCQFHINNHSCDLLMYAFKDVSRPSFQTLEENTTTIDMYKQYKQYDRKKNMWHKHRQSGVNQVKSKKAYRPYAPEKQVWYICFYGNRCRKIILWWSGFTYCSVNKRYLHCNVWSGWCHNKCLFINP